MSILDHPTISSRYFFPRAGQLENPTWVNVGDYRLACYHEQFDPEAKTLVYYHGNGEIVPDYVPEFVDQVREWGLNCLLVEYRGYGESSGVPLLGSMLDDVEPVAAALPCPPEQTVVYGRSVGSIYAIEHAQRFPQIAGLIVESGIADPLERLLVRLEPSEIGVTSAALHAECDEKLNHKRKIASYDGPLLVLHTRHDELVDVSHAERLHRWSGSASKRLTIFENGGHNTITFANAHEYTKAVSDFVASLSE